MKKTEWIALTFILGIFTFSFATEPTTAEEPSLIDMIGQAVADGKIACGITSPDELKELLGKPEKEQEKDGGGMIGLDISYPEITAMFGKSKTDRDAVFTLRGLQVKGEMVDIGGASQKNKQIVIRDIQDFRKIEPKNVDLRNLDLSGEEDYLKKVDFDSLTQWPPPEKLPPGFNPKKLLEEAKNPGLGIRSLHEQGINGKGVGIAILDQPLLLGHEEYTSRIVRYDASKASWLDPQHHGSPIMSIAVGKTCGVAPGAFVFYYAAPTTLHLQLQADWINEIIHYNKTVDDSDRIRVISISAQPEKYENNDAFLKARDRAMVAGILVVTCTNKGGLTWIEGKDPDNPESYKGGGSRDELCVPTRNKAFASHCGANTYKYSRGLAQSWISPYIAGLAALACQVNPDVKPETILEQLVETATPTQTALVVNPPGFIEAINKACQSSTVNSTTANSR